MDVSRFGVEDVADILGTLVLQPLCFVLLCRTLREGNCFHFSCADLPT
jgi:hypothetical protein